MASAAAKRNLDLVTDSYSRGAVSIQDLLDAQNTSFVSEQMSTNAAYIFLIDLMGVEQAAGLLCCSNTEQSRITFLEQLNRYLKEPPM